jgi:hypothetical protein
MYGILPASHRPAHLVLRGDRGHAPPATTCPGHCHPRRVEPVTRTVRDETCSAVFCGYS